MARQFRCCEGAWPAPWVCPFSRDSAISAASSQQRVWHLNPDVCFTTSGILSFITSPSATKPFSHVSWMGKNYSQHFERNVWERILTDATK